MSLSTIRENYNKALTDLSAYTQKEMTPENRSAFDKASAHVQELRSDLQRLEAAEQAEAEVRAATTVRPPRANPETQQENTQAEAEVRAFREYVTKGKVTDGLRIEERDVMGSAGTAAVLPTSFDPLLQSAIKDAGEIAQFVRTLKTSSGEPLKVADADPSSLYFSVLNEGSATTPVNIPTSGKTVNTDTLTFATTVQNQLLQDANWDLSAFISETFGQVYAQSIAKFITMGNSSNFDSLAASAVNKVTTSGAPTFENLVDLYGSVDYSQLKDSKFIMSQSTWASLMKVKDGDGRYILAPNAAGVPYSSLFGIDIVRSAFSANASTVGNKAIILANPKAYTWRQVGGLSIIRLDQIGALSLQTTFLGVARGAGYHRVQSSNPGAVALTIGAAS